MAISYKKIKNVEYRIRNSAAYINNAYPSAILKEVLLRGVMPYRVLRRITHPTLSKIELEESLNILQDKGVIEEILVDGPRHKSRMFYAT